MSHTNLNQVAKSNFMFIFILLDMTGMSHISWVAYDLYCYIIQGGRVMVTREQLENAVEESVVNGTPTGMFIINFEKLVDIEK